MAPSGENAYRARELGERVAVRAEIEGRHLGPQSERESKQAFAGARAGGDEDELSAQEFRASLG
ncbi:hypothetical protein GCM10023319_22970 [Nocardia iowensis]